LQKVKKTEVADYYDGESSGRQARPSADEIEPTVIKRPMDLATLMKRVKSQMYRNKKSFADDLDLIWSNCLLYNSHPVRSPRRGPRAQTDRFFAHQSHPLRRSAEVLRQKSNQLLEFITDPSLPTRSIYAASVNSGGQSRNGGTPGLGDDDEGGDADGDSDDDIPRVNGRGGMAGINQKLMNGVNGDCEIQPARMDEVKY
jgi:transcriptional activator SPT7